MTLTFTDNYEESRGKSVQNLGLVEYSYQYIHNAKLTWTTAIFGERLHNFGVRLCD
jgi:hypothetical protein